MGGGRGRGEKPVLVPGVLRFNNGECIVMIEKCPRVRLCVCRGACMCAAAFSGAPFLAGGGGGGGFSKIFKNKNPQ